MSGLQLLLLTRRCPNITRRVVVYHRERRYCVDKKLGIRERLSADLVHAMRSKDKQRVSAIKEMQAKVVYAVKDTGKELSEEQVVATLQKLAVTCLEAKEELLKYNRADLAQQEQFRLDTIDEYLPKQMTNDNLLQVVKEAVAELGATSSKDMGKVMKHLQGKLGTSVQNKTLSDTIKQVLNKD